MTWFAAFAVLICAPAGEPMTATLVEGAVAVAGQPLTAGATLRPGDTVETQAGGRAEIALPGGSLLRIGENTRVTLSPTMAQNQFSARLFFGDLWARVHKLVAGETFRVETENGVAGVRGTEFRVEVVEEQPDLVRVYEGVVQVAGHDGRWSHALEPGMELRFRREAEAPRAFDAQGESGHKFMDWVRSRRTQDGLDPGRIRRQENRNPEQEHRTRERIRRRDR
jgi:ferric-dicitrate binding protein FerR (iron transport regulator)